MNVYICGNDGYILKTNRLAIILRKWHAFSKWIVFEKPEFLRCSMRGASKDSNYHNETCSLWLFCSQTTHLPRGGSNSSSPRNHHFGDINPFSIWKLRTKSKNYTTLYLHEWHVFKPGGLQFLQNQVWLKRAVENTVTHSLSLSYSNHVYRRAVAMF